MIKEIDNLNNIFKNYLKELENLEKEKEEKLKELDRYQDLKEKQIRKKYNNNIYIWDGSDLINICDRYFEIDWQKTNRYIIIKSNKYFTKKSICIDVYLIFLLIHML